ncbi:MAG: biotin--[acetyl-CoA-carboxylase] ligase [Cyanobacteria bacterium HKST-UBA04]|nr:biotin--[acetyl-CoA-carboxylase] ligase [Cyanobacteria bacterium HKST-UBA04]
MDGESALTLPPGVWLDTVDSTMDEAKRRLAQGAFEGTGFVVADHQTAGRGTRGRVWVSPAEGLFLSLVLQATVDDPLALTSAYTQAAGVACVEALQLATGVQPVLKPINDVMLHTPQGVKKLGGILVEADVKAGQFQWVITGVGLNWRHPDFEVPDGNTPVGLESVLSPAAFARLNKDTVIETLIAKLCFWQSLVKAGQLGQVERAYAQRLMPKS